MVKRECEHRIAEVLNEVGLPDMPLDRTLATLSGGERTRIGIARMLLKQPDVLLLDGPANYLNIASIEVIEEALRNYDGALMVVSHDPGFIEVIGCNRDIRL